MRVREAVLIREERRGVACRAVARLALLDLQDDLPRRGGIVDDRHRGWEGAVDFTELICLRPRWSQQDDVTRADLAQLCRRRVGDDDASDDEGDVGAREVAHLAARVGDEFREAMPRAPADRQYASEGSSQV